jgi:hypothetical protein
MSMRTHEEEFHYLLVTEKYMAIQKIGTTWFEQGVEKGRQEAQITWYEQGELQGQRKLLQRLLEKRFGPLNSVVLTRLCSLTEEQLSDISLRLLDSPRSLDELGLGEDRPT